jgi:energy-coupling factor transport system substrate-specific component
MSAMDEMLSNMTVSSSGTVNTPIFTITMVIFLILLLAGIIYVVFKMYEAKKPPVESIVLIAVLTAIATVGRIILMSIPAVNLASFIIIMVGIVFGKEEGFLVGALTAFVSGLFMGMGYWVLFQMLAWGLMGASAGFLASRFDSVGFRIVFGLLWGFFYGWITDISAIFYSGTALEITPIIALYLNGVSYDLTHGVTNAVLLVVLYDWFKKMFTRAKVKYLSGNQSESESISLSD